MWGIVGVFYSNSCCNVSTKRDSHCWDIRLCKANYHNLSRLGIIYFWIYLIYQLPSTPGQCPNFLVMLWFALPKWGLGQAKREEIGRRGISGLAFTSQAHPCKGRSAKYPLPELHGVGDPPLGQANSILGRGHHTSQTQKEVNCQGFPPTVNSWKVVSQLHPKSLVFWIHVDHILDAGSGWNIDGLW